MLLQGSLTRGLCLSVGVGLERQALEVADPPLQNQGIVAAGCQRPECPQGPEDQGDQVLEGCGPLGAGVALAGVGHGVGG